MHSDMAGGQVPGDRHASMGDDDYGSGYRKTLGDFEDYVKMMKDEHNASQFESFT